MSNSSTMTYWNRTIGPFYTAAQVAAMLHVTDDELAGLVETRDVLAVRARNGDTRFPSFQFAGDGAPLPHLREAIRQLEIANERIDVREVDGWFAALQLNSKVDVWGDRTAAELLRTDHAEEVLRQLAWERVPLTQHADNAKNVGIARPIAERVNELTGDIPAEVNLESLFVTVELPDPLAVVLCSYDGELRMLRYRIDGDSEETASKIAASLRAGLASSEQIDGS
jgi:hypothetical protein